MKVLEYTTELGKLYFLDCEEPQKNCVQGKQYDQTELWGYSCAGMQIRSRVLPVGKPNNGKGLTGILVMKKGKKSQIINAVREKKINEV